MTLGRTARQYIAPDAHGRNFYAIDRQFQDLLSLYMEPGLLKQMTPHFERLGELAGNRLDDLAMTADKHPPVLQPRDRFGRDEDWIDYHPSYREMEKIAFEEFGMHAMTHRAGVLGMKEAAHPLVKYGITYLFVQAEFGLMCPVSVSDTSNFVIKRFGSEALKKLLLDRLLSQDPATMLKGTQFMTEKAGGSDVGALETEAERIGVGPDGVERWKLFGQKWFCSHADADVAVLLARPRGAAPGTQGLGMFAMPRRLEDGCRNSYRIVRLKDKLGTRSMASGEIIMDGAVAYLVGDAGGGFKQMMEQVNLSRLSHGVRAAAMMRRCLNEAMVVAQNRRAFGRAIGEYPLLRRQLMKIMLPTEQALSMYAFSADAMGTRQRRRQGGGEPAAHPDAGLQVPRLPRQHPGRQPRPRGEGRPGLHRGMGDRPPGARRADRHPVGGHLQHQRARRGAARRRQGGRPQGADGGAEGQVRTLRRAARPVQGPARRHPRSRRTLRRGGRRRSQRRRSAVAWPPARSITPRRRRCWPGRAPRSAPRAAMRAACCCRGW